MNTADNIQVRKSKIVKYMKKNILISGIIFLAIFGLIGGLWIWSAGSGEQGNVAATPIVTDINFFYGKECPHCQDVEKFMEENKIAEKVKFDSIEVWHNKANSKILLEKVKECSIAEDEVGVPLLYARGKCIIGAPEIEKFFRQEAGI